MSDDLTRKDRDELVRVVRMRAKLAHADIGERQARLKAQIEAELSAETSVDSKYSLSPTACRGILARAERRGRGLPAHLEAALTSIAETSSSDP